MILKRRWRCSGMINSQICVPITHNSAVIVVYDDRSAIHKSHNRLVPKYVNMLLQRYAFDNFVWKKKPNKILALSWESCMDRTPFLSLCYQDERKHRNTHTHLDARDVYFVYREFWCIFWHEFMPKWLVFHVIFCSGLSVLSCARNTAHCMHVQGIQVWISYYEATKNFIDLSKTLKRIIYSCNIIVFNAARGKRGTKEQQKRI